MVSLYIFLYLFPGQAVASLHFSVVRSLIHHIPVPLLVGPSNCDKTFLAKLYLAILGLDTHSVYNLLTPAKAATILGQSLAFVLNDPKKAETVEYILNKVTLLTKYLYYIRTRIKMLSTTV